MSATIRWRRDSDPPAARSGATTRKALRPPDRVGGITVAAGPTLVVCGHVSSEAIRGSGTDREDAKVETPTMALASAEIPPMLIGRDLRRRRSASDALRLRPEDARSAGSRQGSCREGNAMVARVDFFAGPIRPDKGPATDRDEGSLPRRFVAPSRGWRTRSRRPPPSGRRSRARRPAAAFRASRAVRGGADRCRRCRRASARSGHGGRDATAVSVSGR